MKKILFMALSAAMLAGCSKDITYDSDASQGDEVRFSAASATRAHDAVWENDDRVGVFAYDGTNPTQSNAQYKITNAQNGTMDKVTDADRIFLPQNASRNFYAYYPYNAAQSGTTYAVDATDQTKVTDLLWAKAEGQSVTNVTLQFSHQMVQLSFSLNAGNLDISDFTGLTATLKGTNATANFDLTTGAFSDPKVADIALNVEVDADDKTVATASAFVVPSADLSGVSVVFQSANGDQFVWSPATAKWNAGEKYAYTIKVGRQSPFTDAKFIAFLHDIYNVPVEANGLIDPDKAATATALQGIIKLDVGGHQFSSLAGIECMTNMEELTCACNSLTTLDVSHNTALTYLDCNNNHLTSLNVSGATALTDLFCISNSLPTLDVSHNTALTLLQCGYNSLTTLDVSHNTALANFVCSSNSLTTLDVSKNTKLFMLGCRENRLTSLDVSQNTLLTSLDCGVNSLPTLDVSHNTALTNLSCDSNSFTSLDVSKNTALTYLSCDSNSLPSLDVTKNTALTKLYCGYNSLSSLNVSLNPALTRLYCADNLLSSLNVSLNPALTDLNCGSNALTSLDVSHNTELTDLNCFFNFLTSLDISMLPKLRTCDVTAQTITVTLTSAQKANVNFGLSVDSITFDVK